MLKKLIRILLTLAGVSTGAALANNVTNTNGFNITKWFDISLGEALTEFIFIGLSGLILGIIIFLLSPFLIRQGEKLAKYIEKEITKLPSEQVLVGFVGLISGFLVEFVRQPDGHLGFIALDWLTMGQLLSLPMVLVGAALIGWAYRTNQPVQQR